MNNSESYGKCRLEALRLHRAMRGSKILRLERYIGGFDTTMDSRLLKLPPHRWVHYVVLTEDGMVLDPTARQFGESERRKYPSSWLKNRWGKIYETWL